MGLPRMRGGGPGEEYESTINGKSSPHARGWSPVNDVGVYPVPVFPACAGVVPC